MEPQYKKVASVEELSSDKPYYAYDVEVIETDHSFIANNILVHNSLFFSWDKVFESCGFEGDKLDFILKCYEHRMKGLFVEKLKEYADSYGVGNIQDFELEYISETIIFLTKKRYVGHVAWTEGFFHERLEEFVYKGVELIRSSTPLFARERVKSLIKILFENPETVNYKDLLKEVREIKREFMLADIEDVCFQTGTNTYPDWVIDDEKTLEFKSGTPQGVKAAALYNYMIHNAPDEIRNKYMKISRGDKVKVYYTNDPNFPVFGFLRGKLPVEIAPSINYELQFKKYVLNIINRFIEASGFPAFNDRLSLLTSIF